MNFRIERAQQGDMLDLMCWRVYGKTEGRVEKVLEHPDNYGLADLPEILPIGTPVTFPDIVDPLVTHTVKLWD